MFMLEQSQTPEMTEERFNKFIDMVELNPWSAYLIKFKRMNYIFALIVFPALITAFYWRLRRKYFETDIDAVWMFSIMCFCVFMINFSNDIGVLVGFLLQ